MIGYYFINCTTTSTVSSCKTKLIPLRKWNIGFMVLACIMIIWYIICTIIKSILLFTAYKKKVNELLEKLDNNDYNLQKEEIVLIIALTPRFLLFIKANLIAHKALELNNELQEAIQNKTLSLAGNIASIIMLFMWLLIHYRYCHNFFNITLIMIIFTISIEIINKIFFTIIKKLPVLVFLFFIVIIIWCYIYTTIIIPIIVERLDLDIVDRYNEKNLFLRYNNL